MIGAEKDIVKPVLVTGANGQLGTELCRAAWPEGWGAVGTDRRTLDLIDTTAIAKQVTSGHEGRPWVAVINAAAYTAVDKAESDVLAAWEVNALAPVALSAACARAGIPLVQLSTDYVFSGDKVGQWEINDPVGPLGVYGASKLGGELAVRTSGVRHVIVRTAWVMSAYGSNFVKTMLRVGAENRIVRVVDDQYGSPTSAEDLAGVLSLIAVRLAEDERAPTGMFHFSNSGGTSWADFAAEIFRQSALRGGPSAAIERIGTGDYPTPARRPVNSLLGHDALRVAYGIVPRPWQSALGDILDELIGKIS